LETFDQAMETLQDIKTNPRLRNLRAIMFLSLKQKGRGVSYHSLPDDKFKQIIDFFMANEIDYRIDS